MATADERNPSREEVTDACFYRRAVDRALAVVERATGASDGSSPAALGALVAPVHELRALLAGDTLPALADGVCDRAARC